MLRLIGLIIICGFIVLTGTGLLEIDEAIMPLILFGLFTIAMISALSAV